MSDDNGIDQFEETKRKSWNYFNGIILACVFLIISVGIVFTKHIPDIDPNKIISLYYFTATILMLFSCKKYFNMMLNINKIDDFSDNYQGRTIYIPNSYPKKT